MIGEGLQKIISHEKSHWDLVTGSKSKTLLAFCFCFILGAGAASLFDPQYGIAYYFYISLFPIFLFLIFVWHNHFVRFFIFSILFLNLGTLRFMMTVPNCSDPSILCNYNARKVTVTGWVSSEPDRRIDGARYTITVTSINTAVISTGAQRSGEIALLSSARDSSTSSARTSLGMTKTASGRLLITTRLYPEYHYGDTLKITCRIERPKNAEEGTFRYDKYLARYGVWSVCNNPIVVILNEAQRSEGSKRSTNLDSSPPVTGVQNDMLKMNRYLMTRIFALKSIVQSHIERLWPEPESSFMAGILFGSKSGMPRELMDNFSKTGVTHIIAVSGFNVTIIVTWISAVLIFFGLRRQHAFWVIVGFIVVFVLFTGATASVVRAGVMGIITLVAVQMGRSSRVTIVLVVSAALMLLGNPYLLVWDAGFQLSFLATMGLVYVSPVLQSVILSPPWRAKDPLKLSERDSSVAARLLQNDSLMGSVFETFVQTLSAIIATLPLILYQFGRLSIVAPLVNVLILWSIAWLMLGGFLALILSFIFYPLGQVAAWVTGVGMKYILFVVEFFGKQSWAAVEWHLPVWGMVGLYALLYFVIVRSNNKIKRSQD